MLRVSQYEQKNRNLENLSFVVVELTHLRTHSANKLSTHQSKNKTDGMERVSDHPDLLRLIFTFLEEDDIIFAGRVSKQWCKVTEDKSLWKTLFEQWVSIIDIPKLIRCSRQLSRTFLMSDWKHQYHLRNIKATEQNLAKWKSYIAKHYDVKFNNRQPESIFYLYAFIRDIERHHRHIVETVFEDPTFKFQIAQTRYSDKQPLPARLAEIST
jgi:hypothetical protein